MAKKKIQKKEISRVEVNGTIIIRYDDGSVDILTTTSLTAEEAEKLFGSTEEEDSDEDDEEDEDEDDDDSDDDEDDEDDDDSDDDEDDEDDDEDSDEEDDDDEEDEDEEITPEALMEMDFEELEDLCDEKDLDTDPDDFDEEEDKLRIAIAKELGITLPKAKASKKSSKKK